MTELNMVVLTSVHDIFRYKHFRFIYLQCDVTRHFFLSGVTCLVLIILTGQ